MQTVASADRTRSARGFIRFLPVSFFAATLLMLSLAGSVVGYLLSSVCWQRLWLPRSARSL